MSKYGVGIGDDFPLDDGRGPGAAGSSSAAGGDAPRDDRAEFEDWKRRRDEWRAQREAWKSQAENWRRQRDEWRARRRAYRDQRRGEYYGGGSYDYGRGWYPHFFGFGLFRLLAFFAVIALIVFAFSHLYVVVGILAVVALFAASRHHGIDPFDFGPHDYSQRPPPPAQPQANQPPASPPATTPQNPAA